MITWRICSLALTAVLPCLAMAGGSGFNVVVVVNQNSTNSLELGNYYCEMRQVPPQNVLRINWSGGKTDWTLTDFNTYLRAPLNAMISARGLTNQIDFVVLSMDIPYRVVIPGSINSTTSVLFYGFKTNSGSPFPDFPGCSLPSASANPYAGTESPFRSVAPGATAGTNVLATMITGYTLDDAKRVVVQGALSDQTFPQSPAYLAKSSDVWRNIRYKLFDDAIFDTRVLGNYNLYKINATGPNGLEPMLGFQTGAYQFPVSGSLFVPGAMADNLTSYGGLLFHPNDHVNILSFLAAGASGSYGTVDEPCNYLEKFPSPHNYFYQARGFSLAECFFQSVTNPYQGTLTGEPLAAPFARQASGSWSNLPPGAVLSAGTNLGALFVGAGTGVPVQQVDLFVDGLGHLTITNIPPARSNVVTLTLNGHVMNYIVPLGATVKTITAGLASLVNSPANQNVTDVSAVAIGDRLELQSLNRLRAAAQTTLAASATQGAGTWLSTHVVAPRSTFLESPAHGIRDFSVNGAAGLDNYLELRITRTNGVTVGIGVTNSSGSMTLSQLAAALVDAVNGHPALEGWDGVVAENLYSEDSTSAEFTLRAQSVGWNAAQIEADLNSSPGLSLSPAQAVHLDQNVNDLRPRNHLYVSAGRTNLPIVFSFSTASLSDGHHELSLVAYEGTHVRTQSRISQKVVVQNGSLAATISLLSGASNTVLGFPLKIAVTANTGSVAKIDLLGTGGLVGSSSGQPSTVFEVASGQLGGGLHPFRAVVTAANGQQYQTETLYVRLVSGQAPEAPFEVDVAAPPLVLSWSATAGRVYEVLSTTNLSQPFLLRSTVTPTNSPAQWLETNAIAPQRFYRIRAGN